MKKCLIALLGFVAPATSFAWAPMMQFQITPNYAAVQVSNPYGFNAICSGNVYGLTQTGIWTNAWFQAIVPAGGYQYAYVYATYPYYFVSATAQVDCQ